MSRSSLARPGHWLKTRVSDDPRPWAVAASLLLSVYTILLPDSPNDDAYLYVRTAEIVISNGLAAAYEHYAWASYSVLMAALVQVLPVDLFQAGYIINALFFALLVYAFLSISREISTESRYGLFAALCILLYPELNEARYLIIRDVGFWALGMLALLFLIRFIRCGDMRQAVGFSLSLLLAATLRPEALIYLLLLPLALIVAGPASGAAKTASTVATAPGRGVLLLLLKMYATLFALSLATALLLLLLPTVDVSELFLRFFAGYQDALQQTLTSDPAAEQEMAEMLFGEHAARYSQEYLTTFIAAGLLPILLMNVLGAIGGPYCGVLLYGLWRRHLSLPRPVAAAVIHTALISLSILFLFLFATRFLSSRYAMLLALLILLLVPGVLSAALRATAKKFSQRASQQTSPQVAPQASQIRRRLLPAFLTLFFTYCAVDSFISFGDSKAHFPEAAAWIKNNTQPVGKLITNSHAIAYHSGRIADYDKTTPDLTLAQLQSSAPGDILAIEHSEKTIRLLNDYFTPTQLQPLAQFGPTESTPIQIYRRTE